MTNPFHINLNTGLSLLRNGGDLWGISRSELRNVKRFRLTKWNAQSWVTENLMQAQASIMVCNKKQKREACISNAPRSMASCFPVLQSGEKVWQPSVYCSIPGSWLLKASINKTLKLKLPFFSIFLFFFLFCFFFLCVCVSVCVCVCVFLLLAITLFRKMVGASMVEKVVKSESSKSL